MLHSMYMADDEAEHICLYGGSFRSIYLKTAFCSQILGKGYRFDGVSREDAQKTSMLNVSIIPCDHADTGSDNICPVCGMEMFLSVEANGTTKLFGTFESAIRYAEQNAGCKVKLLQDITLDEATAGSLMSSYYINFETGEYTLDLAGKALDINSKYFNVYDGCRLTIGDSVGGGKITDSNMFKGRIAVDGRSKLTVTGGDFMVELHSFHQNALTLKGGSFEAVIANREVNRSPFVFIEDGYTFALSDGTRYANDSDVSSIGGVWTTEDVSVVKVPVRIYQIEDVTFYLTSADTEKYLTVPLACYDLNTDNKITLTLEKTDGTVIMSGEYDTSKVIVAGFSLMDLTESSDLYRVKAEFNGYIGYSGTFRITAAVCEHPGYDKDHKCIQCGCDLAAAQTDENKGCTLKMFADVNEKVAVKTGSFTLDATDCKINGALNVAKGADLTVSGGEITGNVICAKGGKLTASDT